MTDRNDGSREIEKWVSKIDKQKEALGKQRDKLDDLIAELQGVRDDCDEAYEALETARDALSRLV